LIQGIARVFAKVLQVMLQGTLKRLDKLKAQGGLKLAEKGKGAKLEKQRKAADAISKDPNYKRCIKGELPK